MNKKIASEIAIGIILLIAIIVGGVVWMQNKKQTPEAQPVVTQPVPVAQTPVTQPVATTQQSYIEVKELGFKLPVDATMSSELTYTIKPLPSPNDAIPEAKANLSKVAEFSSKSLNALNKNCEQGIGVDIVKIPGKITDISSGLTPEDYKENPSSYKQFNGFFLILESYAITESKYSCSKNMDLEKKVSKVIEDSFANASLISQLADETANWQTYKNDKYGFEFKYPPSWSNPELFESDSNNAVNLNIFYKTTSNQLDLGVNNDIYFSSTGNIDANINDFKNSKIYKNIRTKSINSDDPKEIPVSNGVAFYFIDKTFEGGLLPTAIIVGSQEKWTMDISDSEADPKLLKEKEDTFNKILSTFKFTK